VYTRIERKAPFEITSDEMRIFKQTFPVKDGNFEVIDNAEAPAKC
jgi:hypothetical protein